MKKSIVNLEKNRNAIGDTAIIIIMGVLFVGGMILGSILSEKLVNTENSNKFSCSNITSYEHIGFKYFGGEQQYCNYTQYIHDSFGANSPKQCVSEREYLNLCGNAIRCDFLNGVIMTKESIVINQSIVETIYEETTKEVCV